MYLYTYIHTHIYIYIYTHTDRYYKRLHMDIWSTFFFQGFLHVFATFDPPFNGRHVPAGSANEPDLESKPSG